MDPDKPTSRPWRKFAVLYGALMVSTVATLGAVFLTQHEAMTADRYRWYARQMVEGLDLDPSESEPILKQVDRVLERYQSQTLDDSESEALLEAFNVSRLPKIVTLLSIGVRMVPASDLSPDEARDAGRDVRRLIRGLLDGQISEADLGPILTALSPPRWRRDDPGDGLSKDGVGVGSDGASGESRTLDFERILPEEELRAVLTRISDLLTQRGISELDSPGDVASEVERVVSTAVSDDGPGSPK